MELLKEQEYGYQFSSHGCKKGKTWWTVRDERNIKEYWPITRVAEALDTLQKAQFITKIDCSSDIGKFH